MARSGGISLKSPPSWPAPAEDQFGYTTKLLGFRTLKLSFCYPPLSQLYMFALFFPVLVD
jgi:hypothetical protein